MEKIIFHIDVNSAFLSWCAAENLKNNPHALDLRKIPSVIGGDQESRHGVVLAKSLPAKAFFIQTGEPIAKALKKCPNLVIAPADHKLYRSCSKQLMDYLRSLTPDIEQVSIDECYLDYSKISHLYPSCTEAARTIRNSISSLFGFTVNIGISSNKLLAKMASDFEKPDKTHTLFPCEIKEKMWHLPIEKLYMAGKSSVSVLHKLDIHTIGQLACADREILSSHLKSHGLLLWDYANGLGSDTLTINPAPAKNIGNSTTLSKDIDSLEQAKEVLLKLSKKVSSRLQTRKYMAGNISVEIKYHTFISASHQMTLSCPTFDEDKIYQLAVDLFIFLWNGNPIRLLGIRTSKLVEEDAPFQLNLFDIKPTDNKKILLEKSLKNLRKKYGDSVVKKGSSLL